MRNFISLLAILAEIGIGHPAAAAEECDEMSILMATTPAQPQILTGLERTVEKLGAIPPQADVIIIGDSLMREWDLTLGRDFPGASVWNFSAGGNRTQNVIWSLNRLAPPKTLMPKAVVIGVGTNNLSDRVSPCAILRGVRKGIDWVRKTWPRSKVFVFEIIPRGADFKDLDEVRHTYNDLLAKAYENSRMVTVVRVDDLRFTCGQYSKPDLPKDTLQCLPQKAYFCENYQGDHVHLSSVGYQAMRAMLSTENDSGPKVQVLR